MAKISQPQKVKLICGLIAGSEDLLQSAAGSLAKLWGPVDIVSEVFDFSRTNYYEKEMGSFLLRQFVSFERLILPNELADIKRATNVMEEEFALGAKVTRPVNIDPGYVALSKLVLASMKDFSHRIYLGGGVYGEITLQYRLKLGWQKLDWTFPDYASGDYFDFLTQVRQRLHKQLDIKKGNEL